MQSLVLIFSVAILVLMVVCASKESKVTGLYKTFGVYGRFKAYLALDFVMVGVMMGISPIIAMATGYNMVSSGEMTAGSAALFVVVGIVILALGILLYLTSYRKCPDFLKKKCIPSMILSGFGVAIKVCFFFFGFFWKLTGPQEMVSDNGEKVYVYGGYVYDQNGQKVGETTSADTYVKTN